MLCSSGKMQSVTLALEHDVPLKARQKLLILSRQCMLLFIVCFFELFIENSLRTNACVSLEAKRDTSLYPST